MMKILVTFAAIVAVCLADNRACPHPDESTRLLHAQRVVVERPEDGRHNIRVEVPDLVIRDQPITCITTVSDDPEEAPAFLGAGRNREGGLSLVMHSKERGRLDANLYVYTAERLDAVAEPAMKKLPVLPITIEKV